jgi:hypothetical protein
MNPEGMVALLNYREDGSTREYPRRLLQRLDEAQAILSSLFHFLEGWSEAD